MMVAALVAERVLRVPLDGVVPVADEQVAARPEADVDGDEARFVEKIRSPSGFQIRTRTRFGSAAIPSCRSPLRIRPAILASSSTISTRI